MRGQGTARTPGVFRWLALTALAAALALSTWASARADDDVGACVRVVYGQTSVVGPGSCTRPCNGFPGGPSATGTVGGTSYDIYGCLRGL
jgi:hypothetical protein